MGNERTVSQFGAIFFDFDGVLVDSLGIKLEGFRELFSDLADDDLERVLDYHREHGGISRVEKIRYAYDRVLRRPLSEGKLAQLANRYSTLVMEKVASCQAITGSIELLEKMKGKCPMFLISGTPEEELKAIVTRRNLDQYFLEVLGSPIKKPTHIRRLLNQYELRPDASFFIGDALTDYDAAAETGLSFIGVEGVIEFPPNTLVFSDCLGVCGALEGRFAPVG